MTTLLIMLAGLAGYCLYLLFESIRLKNENRSLKGENRFLDGRVKFINRWSSVHGRCSFISLDGENWYAYERLSGHKIVIVGAKKVNQKIIDHFDALDELARYTEINGSIDAADMKPIEKDLLAKAGISVAR